MTTPTTPYATSPTPYITYQEENILIPEGVAFSPFQETSEPWSSPQTQVVPDSWLSEFANQPHGHPAQGLPLFNSGYHQESPIPETHFSAQQDEDTEDCKYPPHVLEQRYNSRLSPEPYEYFDPVPLLRVRLRQLERGVKGLHGRIDVQHEKLKSREKVIEKLRERVYEQGEKIEGQERKIKSQERKLKGHEYRVRKRYNTRSGKN